MRFEPDFVVLFWSRYGSVLPIILTSFSACEFFMHIGCILYLIVSRVISFDLRILRQFCKILSKAWACSELIWSLFDSSVKLVCLRLDDTELVGLCRSISNFQSQFQVMGLIFQCGCFEFSFRLALSYSKRCPVWCCQILELACCLQHCLLGLISSQYSCAGSCLVWHVTGGRLCRNRPWVSLFMISFAIYTSWLYCRICCDFRFVLYRPVWLDFDGLHEFWAG